MHAGLAPRFTQWHGIVLHRMTPHSATWRTHMNAMRQNADVLKSQWDKSNKYDGYWRGEEMTRKTQYEEMLGNRGKGYSVGNHMTDTNSVESVLEGLEKNAAR